MRKFPVGHHLEQRGALPLIFQQQFTTHHRAYQRLWLQNHQAWKWSSVLVFYRLGCTLMRWVLYLYRSPCDLSTLDRRTKMMESMFHTYGYIHAYIQCPVPCPVSHVPSGVLCPRPGSRVPNHREVRSGSSRTFIRQVRFGGSIWPV